ITAVGLLSEQLLKTASPAHMPAAIVTVAGLILGLVVLLMFSVWLMRRRPSYTWLYAYLEGLAIPAGRGGPPDLIRWERIESLYNVWQNVFNAASEDSEPRFVAYRLRLIDGHDVVFPLSYRNMLDPYAEIGPLLTSILPGPVAETLPSHPTLGQI